MTLLAPLCIFCRHLRESTNCDAFPGGIPDDVLYAFHDHRMPFPGDHGIMFELRPGEEGNFEEWCRLEDSRLSSCIFTPR